LRDEQRERRLQRAPVLADALHHLPPSPLVPHDSSSTPRRDFLVRVASTTAAVVAGAACASPLAAAGVSAGGVPRRGTTSPDFDDTWTTRVRTAPHRAVFDSPDVADGLALGHAAVFMDNYHDMFGTSDADTVPVIVLRHQGTVIAMGDALWEKYELGKRTKLVDPVTGAVATRNPFVTVAKDDPHALIEPGCTLPVLRARGAVLLACNRALMHFATQKAREMKLNENDVKAEFRAGLVPGVILQPSGIYAVIRAQEAGCGVVRST
jgi:hypothetical protein